jgi:Tfp pilus assembly protein PilV
VVAHPLNSRAGVSVLEVLIALLIGLFVLQLGLETLARLRSAQAALSARADALVALRVGSHVLRRELRHGLAGRDWAASGDSLALRAFRATAVVCASDSAAAELTVRYRGDRAPDPSKDSVLVTTPEGVTTVHALVGVGAASSACAAPGVGARLRLDRGAPSGAVLARVFERGSYHLSDAALRYRRGASGRQPLTPEVWTSATAWDLSGDRLGVEVVPSSRGGVAWSGFLAWRTPE